MRRHATPIGWPRRNPQHYRFAMPNAVWEYKLKPVEFVIFSYLCYHRPSGTFTPEVIATDVHMTTNTVKKYLEALVDRGLVTAERSLALDVQCITSEKFFTLPNEVFLLQLPPSAYMVYAYLLLIEDRRTHTCHPSYNTIAAATRLAKNTAMKSIGTLLEMGLITVESSSYFDKCGMKWKGNNLYTILPVRSAADTFHQRQLHQLELDAVRRRRGGYEEKQDKGRGSLMRPSASHTAPQSGSGLFNRWSEFQLFAVAGGQYQQIQRENRHVPPFHKVAVTGGFPEFHGSQCGGHFLPPGGKSGVSFSSALTAAAKSAGQGGDICEFQEEHHAEREIKSSPQISPCSNSALQNKE